jgi:hypothetical protein
MLSVATLLLSILAQAPMAPAPVESRDQALTATPPAHSWGSNVLAEESRAVMPRLKKLMREGLRRTEPETNFVKRITGDTLFSGSYDWHSNLFAHWALLTIARVEADKELRDWLLEPITLEALTAERERLIQISKRDRALPTFPYDQGWLLLFLAELEKQYEEIPDELRAFRLEVEVRLLDWLESSEFPAQVSSRFEKGRYPGFYRSWLFSFFQVHLSQPVSKEATQRLATLQRERLVLALEDLLAQTEAHPFDFFYVPAMPTLVHAVAPFEGGPPKLVTPALTPLPEEVSLRDVHVLGTEISHMWPLAAQAQAGNTQAKTELNQRMSRFLAREDLWAEDFTVVTHWVPQFLWLTFWLADGRP